MTLAAPAAPPLLALHEVHCEIAAQPVVRGVSFELAAGELGCLLGPSGCGKTTLLRAIAGFQPVARGRIDLRGEEASSANRAQPPERRGLGFVFQDLALFPHLDVASNVGFGLQALARGARVPRVRETLDLLGLADFAARYPHELSGGQQQRVAIARALAGSPRLLLADEPTGNLDTQMARGVMELLEDINAQGTTIVMVTHDPELAARAQRNVHVIDGQVTDLDDVPHLPSIAPERAAAAAAR